MRLHRIALAKHSATAASAFGGEGGLYGHGRWHIRGRLIVYAASNTALAMAEALVHIQRSNSTEAFNHWEIEISDALVSKIPALPPGWKNDIPFTQTFGDRWLADQTSVAQLVPSALVPNDLNCLINPAHPKFDLRWVVSGPHPFEFDPRLTRH